MKLLKKCLISVLAISLTLSPLTAFGVEHIRFDSFEVGETIATEAPPIEQTVDLQLAAKSSILMEATTGKILYQQNEGEILPPASITKIMTLLLIMEDIASGKVKLEDTVNISAHAMSMGGSQIWLEPGENLTVDELLKATAIASANDAAMALAEHVEGSEAAFVERMNRRAKELKMENTTFLNPTGLDAEGHLTTAKDIALMSKELLKHEYILTYTTTWMDTLRDGKTQLVNTNKLVRFYEGTTGLKTGTTNGAGSCLSASAERNGLKLVAVVMGSPTSDDRFASAKKLLDYGFSKFEMAEIPQFSQEFPSLTVKGGEKEEVPIQFQTLEKVLVPKGEKNNVTVEVKLPDNLSAPVEEGQIVGKVSLKINETLLSEYPVVAKEKIEPLSLTTSFFLLLQSLFQNK